MIKLLYIFTYFGKNQRIEDACSFALINNPIFNSRKIDKVFIEVVYENKPVFEDLCSKYNSKYIRIDLDYEKTKNLYIREYLLDYVIRNNLDDYTHFCSMDSDIIVSIDYHKKQLDMCEKYNFFQGFRNKRDSQDELFFETSTASIPGNIHGNPSLIFTLSKEVYLEIGLFKDFIIGGNDNYIYTAIVGIHNKNYEEKYNTKSINEYLKKSINKKKYCCGFIDDVVEHIWHGDVHERLPNIKDNIFYLIEKYMEKGLSYDLYNIPYYNDNLYGRILKAFLERRKDFNEENVEAILKNVEYYNSLINPKTMLIITLWNYDDRIIKQSFEALNSNGDVIDRWIKQGNKALFVYANFHDDENTLKVLNTYNLYGFNTKFVKVKESSLQYFLKESLINIAIKSDDECDSYICVDADVVFPFELFTESKKNFKLGYQFFQGFREVHENNEFLKHSRFFAPKTFHNPGLIHCFTRQHYNQVGYLYKLCSGQGDNYNASLMAGLSFELNNDLKNELEEKRNLIKDKSLTYCDITIEHLFHGTFEERQYLFKEALFNYAYENNVEEIISFDNFIPTYIDNKRSRAYINTFRRRKEWKTINNMIKIFNEEYSK